MLVTGILSNKIRFYWISMKNDPCFFRKVIKNTDVVVTGKIMNRMLFEGQIEGALHMGMGYALTEDLPMMDGKPVSLKFKDLGILRADEMPQTEIIGIEVEDPVGPYGAKGIGEIGMVPTAAAIANAYYAYDGIKRTKLPLSRKKP